MKSKSKIIMKKILFLILTCAAVSGCGSNKANHDLPNWVFNPYIKNGVAASGLAYPNVSDQKLVAENDARAEISKIIHAKFSRVTSDILGQIDFKNSSQVKKIFDQATNEVIKNLPLSKASVVSTYQDRERTLYVRLFLKNEDYQKSPKAVQEIYQKHVDKSYLKNGDREKANEAIKALFGHSKNHYWIHRADLY